MRTQVTEQLPKFEGGKWQRSCDHLLYGESGETIAKGRDWATTEAIRRKLARFDAMESALNSCLEYLDGKVDVVDGDYGVPAPNREMSLVSEINEALGEGGY